MYSGKWKNSIGFLVVGKCMVSWSQTHWRCFASTILKNSPMGERRAACNLKVFSFSNWMLMWCFLNPSGVTNTNYCNFKTSTSMGLGKLKQFIPSSFHQNGWKPKKPTSDGQVHFQSWKNCSQFCALFWCRKLQCWESFLCVNPRRNMVKKIKIWYCSVWTKMLADNRETTR
jgi:hypothetical protein